jgi:hypothetical protein
MVVAAGVFFACVSPFPAAAALPPDPDNAALLYYQAFLVMAQADDRATTDVVANVVNGTTAPNDKVREYVEKCRTAIDHAVTASSLPHCDWGLVYSQGFSMVMPHLIQARALARLILAEARILSADGNYRPALERCLTTYKLAGHLGEDVLISVLVSSAITAQANKCVTAVLDRMPADAGTLTWLKDQLARTPLATLAIKTSMTNEREVALQYLRPERREDLIKVLAESTGILGGAGGLRAEELRQMATDQVLERARQRYTSHLDSVLAVLSGSLPYGEAYARLQQLAKQTEQDASQDPALQLLRVAAPAMTKMYSTQVRHRADFHALQAAVEVYLAQASTGRLPPTLPATAPKDPYTGGAFQYGPAGNGFTLECGAKDLEKNEVRKYEFQIK